MGAGIDVLTTEPAKAGKPLPDLRLANCMLRLRVAEASAEVVQFLADQLPMSARENQRAPATRNHASFVSVMNRQ
jgi:hypothetical protein